MYTQRYLGATTRRQPGRGAAPRSRGARPRADGKTTSGGGVIRPAQLPFGICSSQSRLSAVWRVWAPASPSQGSQGEHPHLHQMRRAPYAMGSAGAHAAAAFFSASNFLTSFSTESISRSTVLISAFLFALASSRPETSSPGAAFGKRS